MVGISFFYTFDKATVAFLQVIMQYKVYKNIRIKQSPYDILSTLPGNPIIPEYAGSRNFLHLEQLPYQELLKQSSQVSGKMAEFRFTAHLYTIIGMSPSLPRFHNYSSSRNSPYYKQHLLRHAPSDVITSLANQHSPLARLQNRAQNGTLSVVLYHCALSYSRFGQWESVWCRMAMYQHRTTTA